MRNLSAGFLSNSTAQSCSPILLLECVFESLTLRLWNGINDIPWNTQTWLGNGWLRAINGPGETDDFSRNSLDVLLSGIPETLISMILSGSKQGASGKLWAGFLASDYTVVADPYLIFDGLLDTPEIADSGGTNEITLAYEQHFINSARSKDFRYDTETQKIFYPDDKGFEFITPALEWSGFWGVKKKPRDSTNKKSNSSHKDTKSGSQTAGGRR